MVNKELFQTQSRHPSPNAVNQAGGTAFSMGDEHALCQYVATGTFNQTYYASAREQLDVVKKLVEGVSSEVIAKAAVYGRETAKMKDVPSYLMAVLAARGEIALLNKAWPRVIVNVKMLLNFVQIIRSGVTGRTSFGSAVKRLIQDWILSKNDKQLLNASIGHSKPSLADVIKMVHPKPRDVEQSTALAYIIGKDVNIKDLPQTMRQFEVFKQRAAMRAECTNVDNLKEEVPDVSFRALTNCELTKEHWEQIAINMPWNTLRMNVNMLNKNGVFENKALTGVLANRLADAEQVRKWNAFPYQLLTAYQNTTEAPFIIREALQDAMEIATENIPELGSVAVCVDTSGSMAMSVTGWQQGRSSVTTCMDVASLIGASIARTNKTAEMVAWASIAKSFDFNPRDSIMSNTKLFSKQDTGHGTDASTAIAELNRTRSECNLVVIVTDNQSWVHHGNSFVKEWNTYKGRNRSAKLVVIDVLAEETVMIPDNKDILNIGGFNDSVFNVIAQFVNNNEASFVKTVKSVEL